MSPAELVPSDGTALDLAPHPIGIHVMRIPPVVVALVFAALMWGAAKLAHPLAFNFAYAAIGSAALALMGVTIAALGVIEFQRAKTTVNPLKLETVSAFVTSGVFRVTRNPMYLGLLVVLVAWALFLRNWVTVLGAPFFVAYMNRFQIEPEERILFTRFGEQFTAYRLKVRRWL